MSTSAGPDSKQDELSSRSVQEVSTKEHTIQDIRSWDEHKLLEWIKQNLSRRLKRKYERKLLSSKIDGDIFLDYAGDSSLYEQLGISSKTSHKLAKLATSVKSKYCRLHYTRHIGS